VFARPQAPALDVDEDLYGGFVSDRDRRRLNEFRVLSPDQMGRYRMTFDDVRLSELAFRYRARNFPATLSPAEIAQWNAHLQDCWQSGAEGQRTLEGVLADVARLQGVVQADALPILQQLADYLQGLVGPGGS
jgi:exodeoxyribonuclease-1